MQLHTAGLLLVAALAQSASGAVRWDILNRRASEHLPPNATAIATPAESTTHSLTVSISTEDPSPSAPTLASSTSATTSDISHALSVSNEPEQSSSSIGTSNSDPTTSAADHGTSYSTSQHQPNPLSSNSTSTGLDSLAKSIAISNSQLTTTSTTANSTPAETDGSRRIPANRKRPPSTPDFPTTPRANTTREPDSTTTPSRHASVPSIVSSLNGTQSNGLTTRVISWNGTQSHGLTTMTTSGPQSDACTELHGDEPVTVFSIVFTATVTIYGNRSEYTPPYPTIETPVYCGTGSTVPPMDTLTNEPHLTSVGGFITATKKPPGACSDGEESGCDDAAASGSSDDSDDSEPINTEKGKQEGETQSSSSRRVTVTFVTTDKNPSAVFPSEPVPEFSQSGEAGSITVQQHKSVQPSGSGQDNHQDNTQGGNSEDGSQDDPRKDPQSLEQKSHTAYTITARAGYVIINGKTYSSLQPEQTTTVTVSDGTFTIYPTAVVGEGATVTKPQPVGTAVTALTPTTGSAGGLSVIVSGSEAVVGGTTMEIPPLGTTTTVNNEVVSIGPGKVVVGDETMTFRAVGGYQTDVVVKGGEMITAVGQSIFVFNSTTLTYGPEIPETSEVVDDDTITIGPSGIVVDGTTIGGTSADATDTTYEIVGGATITEVSPSFVIIDGTTFTAGPKASQVIKVIGGETITIGPNGVVISTMTLKYPFGSSVVTTIEASATGSDTLPAETGAPEIGNDDEDNAGYLLQPSLAAGMTGLCIAIGVWIWL